MIIIDIETSGIETIEKVLIPSPEDSTKLIDSGERKLNVITCISCLDLNSEKIISFYGENEKEIIEKFLNYVKDEQSLVGFNIDFDLNFIRVKALLNNIKLTNMFKGAKFLKIYDLRFIINSNKYAHGRLQDYCRFLGIEVKTHNGEKMVEYYKNKEFDKIKEHCEEDVLNTKKLYIILKDLNFI